LPNKFGNVCGIIPSIFRDDTISEKHYADYKDANNNTGFFHYDDPKPELINKSYQFRETNKGVYLIYLITNIHLIGLWGLQGGKIVCQKYQKHKSRTNFGFPNAPRNRKQE